MRQSVQLVSSALSVWFVAYSNIYNILILLKITGGQIVRILMIDDLIAGLVEITVLVALLDSPTPVLKRLGSI